jgi:hypothetical protein
MLGEELALGRKVSAMKLDEIQKEPTVLLRE